ncbi:zinc-binding dehydrogenase [Amycolatopsis sp.]|uniref:zinc-binding dehydrogenase n=1 Tax=Amycolatopsis sp. TaxID=37632 RepID=UPI002CCA786A|nr:zinc-binding dehydrogenase [Amycolatopsis sp.]HVV08866.1 zinc-binding dehydrogenase [Amycolatopsis sp.]
MRAIRVREVGLPEVLRLEDVGKPTPGPGEALVAVDLAGVVFGDVIVRSGRFPFELPYTPGIEVGGQVVAVGRGTDESIVGQQVVATTVGNTGGYAEFARVTEIFPVPAGLPLAQALAVFQAGYLAEGMLEVMGLTGGETVLITAAAGRVGSLLVQLAKARGAKVIGAAGGPEKDAAVAGLGADVVVDYRKPDWFTGLRADVVLDAIGGELGKQALETCTGRFGIYGFTSGRWTESDSVLRPLHSLFTQPAEEQRALARKALESAAAGKLVPLLAGTYPLAKAADAHAALENRRTIGALSLSPAAGR